MDQPDLSYSDLERRIEMLPDGPAGSLNRPGWTFYWNVAGMFGVVAGLLPSMLILFWEPKMWMAHVAQVGVLVAAVGFAPGFFHSTWQVVRSFRNWRTDQTAQLDHDFPEWHRLCRWVATHPRDVVEKHLRFVQMAQSRMAAKLGFIAGGIDRLGVLPLVIAFAVQVKVATDAAAIQPWLLVIGLFAAVTYMVAMVASLMRLRLQLYEMVLTEALAADEIGAVSAVDLRDAGSP